MGFGSGVLTESFDLFLLLISQLRGPVWLGWLGWWRGWAGWLGGWAAGLAGLAAGLVEIV